MNITELESKNKEKLIELANEMGMSTPLISRSKISSYGYSRPIPSSRAIPSVAVSWRLWGTAMVS